MSGSAELTSIAYKKGNWMRYTLWGTAAVCIAILLSTFLSMMNSEISAVIPVGYKFSVTDNYIEGSNVRTTYYVYDDSIFVEDESFEKNTVNRTVLVYDGISTASLNLNPEDTTDICELGSCHQVPKILPVIKQLIARRPGREYIGL
ncbi:hypothetical protein G3RUM_00489 [Candidatus Nanosyncoccus alces]|uniref:Uncharacterized protein n=2 Tax=Candidatus Nanosyncoccus alces TaxID=2171997 RepID=A0ABY0FLL5_9BACT|nr:hypothetical protein G3RUM_00489 [Candidatus Nanosyncoccus alces]